MDSLNVEEKILKLIEKGVSGKLEDMSYWMEFSFGEHIKGMPLTSQTHICMRFGDRIHNMPLPSVSKLDKFIKSLEELKGICSEINKLHKLTCDGCSKDIDTTEKNYSEYAFCGDKCLDSFIYETKRDQLEEKTEE